MMMSLDSFLFEIGTLPFQQLQQEWNWRHAKTDRFGARPATQFLGVGEETITLSGALYPGVAGDYSSFSRIQAMASTGESYILLNGLYEVMGHCFIRKLARTSEIFLSNGFPRKSDFTLELERAA